MSHSTRLVQNTKCPGIITELRITKLNITTTKKTTQNLYNHAQTKPNETKAQFIGCLCHSPSQYTDTP